MAIKLLIIDDEPDIVNSLKEFFEMRGYEAVCALDGIDGLKKFDSARPDIILLDLKMPRKDGYELLKAIRSGEAWVPVIIISALVEPKDVFKGYEFEADYYITKPINYENLLKGVQVMTSLIPLRKDK